MGTTSLGVQPKSAPLMAPVTDPMAEDTSGCSQAKAVAHESPIGHATEDAIGAEAMFLLQMLTKATRNP